MQPWEVVAHLCLQPALARPVHRVRINTACRRHRGGEPGWTQFARRASRRVGARSRRGGGRNDFAKAVRDAMPALRAADLFATVVTLQGPIRLADYLVTRCVEAVVHGCDLVDPVSPDRDAQAITARALLEALAVRAPDLVRHVLRTPPPFSIWVPTSTGTRRPGLGTPPAAAVPRRPSRARPGHPRTWRHVLAAGSNDATQWPVHGQGICDRELAAVGAPAGTETARAARPHRPDKRCGVPLQPQPSWGLASRPSDSTSGASSASSASDPATLFARTGTLSHMEET